MHVGDDDISAAGLTEAERNVRLFKEQQSSLSIDGVNDEIQRFIEQLGEARLEEKRARTTMVPVDDCEEVREVAAVPVAPVPEPVRTRDDCRGCGSVRRVSGHHAATVPRADAESCGGSREPVGSGGGRGTVRQCEHVPGCTATIATEELFVAPANPAGTWMPGNLRAYCSAHDLLGSRRHVSSSHVPGCPAEVVGGRAGTLSTAAAGRADTTNGGRSAAPANRRDPAFPTTPHQLYPQRPRGSPWLSGSPGDPQWS